jgi:hypothetical protein
MAMERVRTQRIHTAASQSSLLALVEHDLERGQPDRHERESPVVDAAQRGAPQVRRVLDEGLGHREGDEADRQVDVEDPPP